MKKTFFYTILFLIPISFCIIVLEVILPKFIKVPHLVYKSWNDRPVTFYPSMIHRSVSPNYDVYFKSNSLGFKDREHDFLKGKGVYRVLLLGDSFVQAQEVPIECQTSSIMEKLAKQDSLNMEVISLGMSSYGQSHQLITYEKLGRKFDPDLVISFFCPNDIHDNLRLEKQLGKPVYLLQECKLICNFPEKGPEEALDLKELVPRKFLNRTETYFFLRYVVVLVYQRFFASEKQKKAAQLAVGGKIDSSATESQIPASFEELELFGALVKEMKNSLVDRDSVIFVNTIVSSLLTSEPSDGYFHLLDHVEKTYGAGGIETINFNEIFKETYEKTGILPSWENDGHWNKTGHQWVGELLYRHIKKLIQHDPTECSKF
ncbi:MAG: hypothetical protein U9P14_01125 [Gemmatimonadota bacterium]|nr:hypothetical protein [Gemmatimonadota bacterium]